MTLDLRTDRPVFTHRLGVALQFFDAFTRATIRTPLTVRLPTLRLEAVVSVGDASYRFLVREPPTPASYAVTVDAPDYVSHEPIDVQLPRTPATPPKRSDFLVRVPLWPTTVVRVPAGETAVIGNVRVGTPALPAANYKVVLHTSTETPGNVPYARTDANGDFLYRLNRLVRDAAQPATRTLTAVLVDPAGSINPASVTVELGRVLTRQFTVP